jgi:transcription elongation factor Elf1
MSQTQAQKDWYTRNSETKRLKSKQYREEVASWFQELKKTMKCHVCGENHIACLDFHHKDPTKKDFNISQIIYRVSKETLLEEIAKCDILCANCHRKFHYEQTKNGNIG